jgi:hypothetical protein
LMFLICFVEFKFVSKLDNVLMIINHVIFIWKKKVEPK